MAKEKLSADTKILSTQKLKREAFAMIELTAPQTRFKKKDERAHVLNFNSSSTDKNQKAISTWASQAVPHLSTNHALSRLTSEFEWDPVLLA